MRRSSRGLRRRAFTRLDLAVLLVIGTVFMGSCGAMLQNSKEAAQRSACANNLKQIGLGLLQYETQFRSFPYGARVQSVTQTQAWSSDWGPSWWLGVTVFTEEGRATRNFDYKIPQCALIVDKTGNGAVLHDLLLKFMHCPASPLPAAVTFPSGVKLAAPTYVAISGTVPDLAGIPLDTKWQADWLPKVADAKNPPQGASPRCTAQANPEGTVGGSGMFPPNQAVTIAGIRDGVYGTIMVGEQSDYGIDATANDRKVDIRSCSRYGAWIGLGNTGKQNIQTMNPKLPGTITAYNCTTIAFPINSKIIRNASSPAGKQAQITIPGLVGISPESPTVPDTPAGLGNNNGIQSAHAGGAYVVFADGRVTFLMDTMDFRVLLYVSGRDDQRSFDVPE